MSLLFMDSCGDHYAAADVAKFWTSSDSTLSLVTGRFGGKAFRQAGAGGSIQQALGGNFATLILGFAFRVSSLQDDNQPICAFLQGGSIQASLFINRDGSLTVKRGSGADLARTHSQFLRANVWYFLELKITFDGSAGTVFLRINNALVISDVSQNTSATGNSYADRFGIWSNGTGHGVNQDFDDVYCCDDTATHGNADFLGSLACELLLPTGAGATTAADSVTGGSGPEYAAVNEATMDGDTSYALFSTAGNFSTYATANMAVTATSVFGVTAFAVARKDDGSARSAATMLADPGGSHSQAGGSFTLSTSYAALRDLYEVTPWTSVAWTNTNVNSLECGFECIA